MITHRDAYGRIRRPSGPPHSAQKMRDERSGRRQDAEPDHLSIRMPLAWMRALRAIAERQQKTVTQVVLDALEPVIHPVIQGDDRLCDSPGSTPRRFGPNRKAQRLEEKTRSPITNPVPAYDQMGRWRQRQAEKAGFKGNLVDRPRR